MRAIDRADLAEAPDLADNAGRDARRDELYGVIDRWAASLPLSEVEALLKRAEVPASRIYSAADMLDDPQFLAREMFLSAKLPDGKAFKMPGIVPKLSDTPGSVEWTGPALGEHNDTSARQPGLRRRADRRATRFGRDLRPWTSCRRRYAACCAWSSARRPSSCCACVSA